MSRELLNFNPLTGRRSELLTDPNNPDQFAIKWEQPIDKIVDENREMEAMHSKHGQEMRLAARVPLGLWMEWERQGITQDPELLKRKLNDPDNADMRVWRGRL